MPDTPQYAESNGWIWRVTLDQNGEVTGMPERIRPVDTIRGVNPTPTSLADLGQKAKNYFLDPANRSTLGGLMGSGLLALATDGASLPTQLGALMLGGAGGGAAGEASAELQQGKLDPSKVLDSAINQGEVNLLGGAVPTAALSAARPALNWAATTLNRRALTPLIEQGMKEGPDLAERYAALRGLPDLPRGAARNMLAREALPFGKAGSIGAANRAQTAADAALGNESRVLRKVAGTSFDPLPALTQAERVQDRLELQSAVDPVTAGHQAGVGQATIEGFRTNPHLTTPQSAPPWSDLGAFKPPPETPPAPALTPYLSPESALQLLDAPMQKPNPVGQAMQGEIVNQLNRIAPELVPAHNASRASDLMASLLNRASGTLPEPPKPYVYLSNQPSAPVRANIFPSLKNGAGAAQTAFTAGQSPLLGPASMQRLNSVLPNLLRLIYLTNNSSGQ